MATDPSMPVRRRYAAIDIGTVTSRMLVADAVYENGRIRVVPLDTQYTITDLGEGVDSSGCLKPEAIERVRRTMQRYIEIRNSFSEGGAHSVKTIACATSASRDASNSQDFTQMMEDLGLDVRIIPGVRESELSFMGATDGSNAQCAMVIDVGGGSTEIAIGHPGQTPDAMHSFDIGSRRLTERFLSEDIPTPAQIEDARSYIREVLGRWDGGVDALKRLGGTRAGCYADPEVQSLDRLCECIAVAGTATSVVSISKGMAVYNSDEVHGTVVSLDELKAVRERLAGLPLGQRMCVVGLDPGRAPVIVAGLLILEEVLEAYGMDSFKASEADILQGMVIADFASTLGSDRIG